MRNSTQSSADASTTVVALPASVRVSELLIALLATACAAPFVRRLSLSHGLLDVPNQRSSHAVVTPRAGGIACATGIVLTLGVSTALGRAIEWPLILCGGVLACVGLVDDKRGLPPLLRLAVQIAVGALLGLTLLSGLWFLVGAATVPIVVNVVNFMDGIDGITSLTMAVWGFSAMSAGTASSLPGLTVLGAVTAGAALGFLPANLSHAGMFLGDVGSYLFGGLVAAGILYACAEGLSPVVLVAPLAISLVDVISVLIRRFRRGASIFQAHREHVYQQLTGEGGFPHLTVSVGIAAAASITSVVWRVLPWWIAAVVTLAICAIYLLSPRTLSAFIHVRSRAA
jgi:UDP-N-acetylmuramyl pentapeptide phosphotransferase/UDP-N-acetylglucosamine-1-phosphate transferase